MGEVVSFPSNGNVKRISIQVSYYPQEDGTNLFCVEKLLPDGTWDNVCHSRDLSEAWKAAGHIASVDGWQLLPESTWPGHSHLLVVEGAAQ